jgi:CheY-like chemotaxis protein
MMASGKRILIVDDDEAVLFVLQETFSKLREGYEVVSATCGREAMEQLANEPCDVMVTDLKMSDMDGVQLTEAVRNTNPGMPVIWLTAYGCERVQAELGRLRVRCCIDKPVGTSEIVRAVREALRSAPIRPTERGNGRNQEANMSESRKKVDIDIPLDADVFCEGSSCGTSVALVMNPVTEEVTHMVVRERHAPHRERLVPTSVVGKTTFEQMELRCSAAELAKMEPFVETHFVKVKVPHYLSTGGMLAFPYAIPDPKVEKVAMHSEQIPPNELAVRRGAWVHATDGRIGKVDEFLVDPTNCHVTHLVLREGHLWAQKEIAIPISEIKRLGEEEVHLKLSKAQVEQLPEVPIHRGMLGEGG